MAIFFVKIILNLYLWDKLCIRKLLITTYSLYALHFGKKPIYGSIKDPVCSYNILNVLIKKYFWIEHTFRLICVKESFQIYIYLTPRYHSLYNYEAWNIALLELGIEKPIVLHYILTATKWNCKYLQHNLPLNAFWSDSLNHNRFSSRQWKQL